MTRLQELRELLATYAPMTRPSSKKINLQKRHKLNLGQYTYNEKDNQMGCITNQTRLEEKLLRTARNTRSLKTLRWLLKGYKYGNSEVEGEFAAFPCS